MAMGEAPAAYADYDSCPVCNNSRMIINTMMPPIPRNAPRPCGADGTTTTAKKKKNAAVQQNFSWSRHDLTSHGGLEQFTVLGIPITSKPWYCWVRMNTMMMS
jgi:hypothetical protein